MYSKIFSFSSIITFTLLILCLTDTAFTLNCYICSSDTDTDCTAKPAQKKFIYNCTFTTNSTHLQSSFPGLLNIDYAAQSNFTESTCAKIIIKNKTYTSTSRECFPKPLSSLICAQYKDRLPKGNTLDVCTFCNTDLCNSSLNINAGIYGLIIPLVTIFAFWK